MSHVIQIPQSVYDSDAESDKLFKPKPSRRSSTTWATSEVIAGILIGMFIASVATLGVTIFFLYEVRQSSSSVDNKIGDFLLKVEQTGAIHAMRVTSDRLVDYELPTIDRVLNESIKLVGDARTIATYSMNFITDLFEKYNVTVVIDGFVVDIRDMGVKLRSILENGLQLNVPTSVAATDNQHTTGSHKHEEALPPPPPPPRWGEPRVG